MSEKGMVERVARAMCQRMGVDPDETFSRQKSDGTIYQSPPKATPF
jgi:hypothetical protein